MTKLVKFWKCFRLLQFVLTEIKAIFNPENIDMER